MRLVQINTTAYSEENFFLITDLTDNEIESVIMPIIILERNNGIEYDNFTLFDALLLAYPNRIVNLTEPDLLEF
jgi:hypothetical protein